MTGHGTSGQQKKQKKTILENSEQHNITGQILKKGEKKMSEIIKWSVDGLHKGNAQKCYKECQSLDEITPQNVLEKARNEKTELHKCFEWDDSVASEKYRLLQARDIIRHFVVVFKDDEEKEQKIRSYQITTETNKYEPTRVILQKPDEYMALLKRAKAELEAFKQRYKMLSELEEIFAEIDRLNS